jgi:hypothetical protein
MLVLNTASPLASPGPVKLLQEKVLPSSKANKAFIFLYLLIAWCCHLKDPEAGPDPVSWSSPLVEAPINIIKHSDLARQY